MHSNFPSDQQEGVWPNAKQLFYSLFVYVLSNQPRAHNSNFSVVVFFKAIKSDSLLNYG